MCSKKVTTVFIEPLMDVFNGIRSNTDIRIQEIAEIIEDLRNPMQDDREAKMEVEDGQELNDRAFEEEQRNRHVRRWQIS